MLRRQGIHLTDERYFSAKTQIAPPSGTSGYSPGCSAFSLALTPRASTPHPDCTAMYCVPSTTNVVGVPRTPELVGNSHRTLPFFASYARNSRSLVPPLKTSPPLVASIGPQLIDFGNIWVQTRRPVSTLHACTSPKWSAFGANSKPSVAPV